MADELLIRCPVCLHKHAVRKNITVHEEIKCSRCGRRFEFQNALPYKDSSATIAKTVAVTDYSVVEEVGFVFWSLSLLFSVISISLIRNHVSTMKGPDFLLFYIMLFLVLWAGSKLLRWLWRDHWAITIIAFIIFEAVAVFRFLDGWSQGMRNFEMMVVFMLFGGFLFFLRIELTKRGRSRDGGCAGGCGSGCGGGGGGCGGCGG